jgi:hypothetical protein
MDRAWPLFPVPLGLAELSSDQASYLAEGLIMLLPSNDQTLRSIPDFLLQVKLSNLAYLKPLRNNQMLSLFPVNLRYSVSFPFIKNFCKANFNPVTLKLCSFNLDTK